jgi:hypothetical protein
MARKPTAKPTGRPLKEIQWTTFEELCQIQCTQSEIASVLKIHHETLIRRVEDNYKEPYASVYKKYSEGGKSSLRRIQFNLARKNTAMAIWLGKQWLGQKDHEEKVQTAPNDAHLTTLLDTLNREKDLKKEIEILREKLDGLIPKADTELPGSESSD